MKVVTVVALLITTVYCYTIKNASRSFTIDRRHAAHFDWWQRAVIYQIYPRSFKDSDGDGIGDLQGIIEKIDYLVDLGVDAVLLSLIYQSPMVDDGYDISDYRAIAKEYGTLYDFKELLAKAHKANIKVILDLIPNHSSDLHKWFKRSVARMRGYEDYYLWSNGTVDESGTRHPPNNWLSLWAGSGWEWNEKRQQYYFHQFSKHQPDLNYRNPKVHQEMKDIMTYWLDKGVDGFRIGSVPHIYEDAELRDEPVNPDSAAVSNDWHSLQHVYTMDQPETYDLVYSWRAHLDSYTRTVGGDTRIFMTEGGRDFVHRKRYYGDGMALGAHLTFNVEFLGLNEETDVTDLFDIIVLWYSQLDEMYTLNWLTGNHDFHRIATRVDDKYIDGYNMLITFLGGVTITYMGEEIGQRNGEVTSEQGQDHKAIRDCSTFDQLSRDFERTPFQWDSSVNAGFSKANKTWLPVGSEYLKTNLAEQQKVENSHYNVYKKLVQWKSNAADASLHYIQDLSNKVLAVALLRNDSIVNLLLFNVYADSYEVTDPENFTVLVQGVNVIYSGEPGEPLILKPGDCVILEYLNESCRKLF